MRRNRNMSVNSSPATTLENVSQDTATATHVTITKKFDKPSLMPLMSSPTPADTKSSQAAVLDFICRGVTCAKPAEYP